MRLGCSDRKPGHRPCDSRALGIRTTLRSQQGRWDSRSCTARFGWVTAAPQLARKPPPDWRCSMRASSGDPGPGPRHSDAAAVNNYCLADRHGRRTLELVAERQVRYAVRAFIREAHMRRVTGIGGIFFHAKDPAALQAWYKTHLGIDVQDWEAPPSDGRMRRATPQRERQPGPSPLRAATISRQASQTS